MTEDAIALTLGAKAGAQAGAQGGTKVLATVIRGTFEFAVAAGVEREVLLSRMGVREAELAEPEHFLPIEAHMAAWDALGELPNAETLGLEIARQMRIDRLGVVGWVVANAPTALDALLSVRRYSSLFGDPYVPQIDVGHDVVVIHRAFEERIAKTRVMPEHAPACTLVILRLLTAADPDARLAREVWFQHEAPREPSEHERFFGCPVRFSAPETRLVLERAAVERPVLGRDPTLYAFLDRHVLALAERHEERGAMVSRVREYLARHVDQGEPSPIDVARALGTSERTLQRRLKDERRTFSDILDEVRRELASEYLASDELAIYEIAFLLGYSETSSFHRAFRRWTGSGPQQFRARLAGQAST